MKRTITPRDIKLLEARGGRVAEWIGRRGGVTVNYVLPKGQPRTARFVPDSRNDP